MFEYQGNRLNQSQSLNRTNSRASSYMREGPYSKLDNTKVKEPPVNSQELHQFDDVADEGVDYSFSNLSVRERKKLFQQQQQNDSNIRSLGPSKNVIGSMNSFHHQSSRFAHETQSDIGDERDWRSKANTWTPKDNFNNQTRTNSPQLFSAYDREEKRGASVINFRPQLSTPTHLRSRTIDTGFNRHNDFFPNTNCDQMTRSAAFHSSRHEHQSTMHHHGAPSTLHLHRNVSGPCTRVIPTTPSRPAFDSGYDSYFDKSRINSPHADRYRSQVHIPLASRNRNNSSFDWQNPRQSRSQQPLRVNVYSNNDARQESIQVPIRTQQTANPYYSMSTSVSPQRRMYNDAVYFAFPANSSTNFYPNTMRPYGFYTEKCQITPSYYTSPRRIIQTAPQTIHMNRSGFYKPMTRTNQVTSSVYNKTYDNTFQTVAKNRERTPMPMTPRSQPNIGDDLNFWTSSNSRPKPHQAPTPRYQTKSPIRSSTQKLHSAFFDEEAGISEF